LSIEYSSDCEAESVMSDLIERLSPQIAPESASLTFNRSLWFVAISGSWFEDDFQHTSGVPSRKAGMVGGEPAMLSMRDASDSPDVAPANASMSEPLPSELLPVLRGLIE
jgi:hypothetical protein